jgi:hypothetical protein
MEEEGLLYLRWKSHRKMGVISMEETTPSGAVVTQCGEDQLQSQGVNFLPSGISIQPTLLLSKRTLLLQGFDLPTGPRYITRIGS